MFKFLVWHVLLVTVSCELYPNLGYKEYAATYDDYQPHDYNFNYAVSDPHTGDHKSQWEVKENGVVRGAYSLLEPDGTTRIVEYIADDHGFRAVVKKLGTAVHPTPVHVQPEVVPVAVPEISQWKAYDGRVDNYGAVLSQPYIQNNLPIVGPQGQYTFETNLGAAVPQQYFEAPKGLEAYQGGQYTYETDFPAPAPQWAPPPPQWAPKVPELAPGLVPISPTYQTNIVYGLTGNPEDDSRYSKDDYSSESSQRISKVVPAPPKEKLLIIYPEPESN